MIDRLVAILLLPLILPVLATLWVVVVALQGRPFIYSSERMRDADRSFWLFKIRTLHPDINGVGEGVLGGHSRSRVTPIGAWLRCYRLDELPQIFNVIRGDIRFIGPRPPLRKHLSARPVQYRQLLSVTQPGITGLATVMLHGREERLLRRCLTATDAEKLYLDKCLPLKLRLDFLYQKRRGPALNLLILWRTFARLGRTFESPRGPRPQVKSLRHVWDRV